MSEELSLPLSKLYDRLWPNADICALIAEAAYGAARISFASTERYATIIPPALRRRGDGDEQQVRRLDRSDSHLW